MNRYEASQRPTIQGHYFPMSVGVHTLHNVKPRKACDASSALSGYGLVIVPSCGATGSHDYREQAFRFDFGAYGNNSVIVWARSFEDALEEAASFIADHWPGLFTPPDYDDARATWESDNPDADPDTDEAREAIAEIAEQDLTYTESGYLASWEWWGGEIDRAGILSEINETLARGRKVCVLP